MKTMFTFLLTILTTFSVSLAATGIPSFGRQTALQYRKTLKNSDYLIQFFRGSVTRTPNYLVRNADLSRFPVLGAQDVQAQISHTVVKSGRYYLRHYHPRSSEVIYVFRGTFRVIITYEGVNPRVVDIKVGTGQATVFPQGLIHQVQCVSAGDCGYVAVFTSADPGSVPVK